MNAYYDVSVGDDIFIYQFEEFKRPPHVKRILLVWWLGLLDLS
jgi:hypothetical protein